MSIPKIIHYIWFGKREKGELIERCIDSWKRFLPGWEIIEWNESNYTYGYKSVYFNEAYKGGKYAFASDYARFDILNRFGGVYLDTDVELLRPIPEYMLENECFSGMELPGRVATGLVLGSIPNHPFLLAVLHSYKDDRFVSQNMYSITVVDRVSKILADGGLKEIDCIQKIGGVTVYPIDYFCAFDFCALRFYPTENTISRHHYIGSWEKKTYKDKFNYIIRRFFSKILGRKKYHKIFSLLKRISHI